MSKLLSAILLTIPMLFLSSCVIVPYDSDGITLADIAYGFSNPYPNTVYLMEDGVYVPYLVFDSSYYNSGVLLLREELTDETAMFKDTNVFNSEGNYYPKSDVNQYLNGEFFAKFSEPLRNAIEVSSIEVTSLSAISAEFYNRNTETFQCKVFLLSATEIGVQNSMAAIEGRQIRGLDKFPASGSQWLRTAYLWDDVHAWACGEGSTGQEALRTKLHLRPAFTLSPSLIVTEKEGIISGESIFVLEIDKM